MKEQTTPTLLAARLGISQPYASQLLNGRRVPSLEFAVRIWRATGVKLGGLASATDAELELLGKLARPQADDAKPEMSSKSAHEAASTPSLACPSCGNIDEISGGEAA